MNAKRKKDNAKEAGKDDVVEEIWLEGTKMKEGREKNGKSDSAKAETERERERDMQDGGFAGETA